jgi:cytoskeletal protein RodZ
MSNSMKPPPLEYQAPSYPYYAPSPGSTQPPRKSHGWVWITVGIVALVSIVGCALLAWGASWAFTTYYNSSLRASDMYYSAIKTQDYSTAYSYLGSHLQTEYSQQSFIQAAEQQDTALGTVSSFGMTNIPTGEPANVTLTVTRANGSTYTVHLELRQEGGAWKVTTFDRI